MVGRNNLDLQQMTENNVLAIYMMSVKGVRRNRVGR